ncbi:MAG: hypothetical protein CFH19_00691 [Alphaproteobacteria bacterium MarineAlpha5_Bin9]|nr:MAG: hypothetical protein CFH19_00691 [Alphaproteobacteria bacterium MarineAlpha5_Bin9]|tara:strand:- start:2082 stop:3017 length:936 start_codon:yes stop_codon:yes gene_type:complete
MHLNNKIPEKFEGSYLLENAVDSHIHCCPHLNKRSIHIFEAVRHALAFKMKGIGLMDNFCNTSGYAALINKEMENIKLDVFGGLIMEPYAGGISAESVKIALSYNYGDNLNTRFISMPTHHTRYIAKLENRSENYIESCLHIPESKQLADPLPEILDLIAENDVVLNTGHLSGEEAIRLISFAKKRGVKRIMVPSSHYEEDIVGEITKLDCYSEFSFFFVSNATEVALTHIDEEKHKATPVNLNKMAKLIKAAGIKNTILSSDCGVSVLPIPVRGFVKFLLMIKQQGFDDSEIKDMISNNTMNLFKIKTND